MMISGPNFELRRFLEVNLREYLILHLIASRSRQKNNGWVSISVSDAEEYLDASTRTLRRVVKQMEDKKLIEKQRSVANSYRLSDKLEELITDKDQWLITCDKYTCWSEVPSESERAILAPSIEVERANLSAERAILALPTIYIENIKENTVENLNANGTITHSTTPSSGTPPTPEKTTTTVWQEKDEVEDFLRKTFNRGGFEEVGQEKRNQIRNHVILRKQLGVAEYEARAKALAKDDFHRKLIGKLSYSLKKIRGMELLVKPEKQEAWRQVADLNIIPRNS
jgi:DNA-binding MarR family transcriptional regulator